MPELSISTDLIAAYADTEYRVHVGDHILTLRVDQASPDLAEAYQRTGSTSAAFITADNPFSETATDAENAVNHAALGQHLRDLTAHIFDGEGHGMTGDWPPEKSYLALGLSREQACALGIQFRQNAIVFADSDAIPRLVLLR